MLFEFLVNCNRFKKGEKVDLNVNDFLTLYWRKKGIIKPYKAENIQNTISEQGKQEKPPKKAKKSMKKKEKK